MSLLPFDEALARILSSAHPMGAEDAPLTEAAGRVLAAPLTATRDQPPFDASAMDGYAVRSADVAEGAALALAGRAEAGRRYWGQVEPGQCVRILTGAPVPEGADAVVMQEEAEAKGDTICFGKPVQPGQNIRPQGNDFSVGAELLPAGATLTPFALALAVAASANRKSFPVVRRPKVTIVSTGDELVPPGEVPGPDQIIASNAPALAALFSPYAGEIRDAGIVPDNEPALAAALVDAINTSDVVVTIGGASVGDRDYVHPVLKSLWIDLDFWKIAMRPGKPLMFGTKNETLVFGLPGNPVSALVTATVLVLPALRRLGGGSGELPIVKARLTANLSANGIRRHFLRGILGICEDGTSEVSPIPETDSAHLTSLSRADCLIVQPENDPGCDAGETVQVIPLK